MKMLRGTLLFLSLATVLLVSVHKQAFSQDASSEPATPVPTDTPFNFDKAYKDYVFTLDTYNKAHSDYQLAKAQYQEAQTLAANSKAREATATMLQDRDDVLSVYLIMLRQRLIESVGIDDTSRQGLTTRLETDIAWYKNHKSKISSVATLEDLSKTSTDAKNHYETTEPLVYEVLATLPVGKVNDSRVNFTDILGGIKQKTASIRANGDLDTSTAERWIIETENKLTNSIDKENEAQTLIAALTSTDPRTRAVNRVDTYNQVTFRLDESLAYLKEASGFTKEVIKQLKTKQ